MIPIPLSRDTVYATKPNIAYPGSQAQATAAEAAAQARINDELNSQGLTGKVTVTVAAGAIKVAT